MKKSLAIIAMGIFALMLFNGSAMAIEATEITKDAAGLYFIGTASGGRPALSNINISPNVQMGYNISTDSFAINSVNSKGVIEYGLANDNANIYFKSVVIGSTPSSLSADDSSSFGSGYAILGGS